MYLATIRAFKEALKTLMRNSWLSISAVIILALSLYIMGMIYVNVFTVNNVLKGIQQKVNISVYFKSDVEESDIMLYKDEISKNGMVQSVNYVSKDQALEDFKKTNEEVIIKSLEEIGDNPLLSSLVIKSNDVNQYPEIVEYLKNTPFSEDISRINYEKNKEIINKLNSNVESIRRVGLVVTALFLFISILIIFNTISLAIYVRKEEVDVMRLVGASNMYIRLPFIFESIIFGIIASLISMFLIFISLKYGIMKVSAFASKESLLSFFMDNFFLIFGSQILIGAFLGIMGSLIAIRKHLKT